MPKQKRKLSKTGTYNIMLRGNERKSLFPEEEDCRKFLQILPLKIEDIPKSQNKHHGNDLILKNIIRTDPYFSSVKNNI